MRSPGHILNLISLVGFVIMVSFPLTSCFTGVEGTKTVELSRSDRKLLAPTPEDTFLSGVKPRSLKDWNAGKRFIVTDDKIKLLFDQSRTSRELDNVSLKDTVLYFVRSSWRSRPDATNESALILRTAGGKEIVYLSGNSSVSAADSLKSDGLAMLIDLDMIGSVDSKLKGRTLWTKSPIRYDSTGNRIHGKKYIPVKVVDVCPGTTVFPVKLKIKDDSGAEAYMLMNFGNSATDSRSFANLFSLSDIRQRYPSIEDDVWKLICNGRVKIGMTKDQCRLSLGNPADVRSGHDYNRIIDIWVYGDGDYLQFADGLLIDFKMLK